MLFETIIIVFLYSLLNAACRSEFSLLGRRCQILLLYIEFPPETPTHRPRLLTTTTTNDDAFNTRPPPTTTIVVRATNGHENNPVNTNNKNVERYRHIILLVRLL
jgi:hypothetical protein